MDFHFDWSINWASVLQKLLTIGLIILVAYIVYYIAKVVIKKAMFFKNGVDSKGHRLHTLRSLITNIVLYVIIFITVVAILSEFNIDATGIIASAGVVGLAIGIGAKDLISDVGNGFFSLMEDQVNVGEYVTVNDLSGVVEEVGLRVLRIRDVSGDLHFISNRQILTLTNHSRGNMRALVDISLPTKINVEDAITKLQAACAQWKMKYTDLVEGPDVIGVEQLGTDEYVIRVIAKTKNGKQFEVERELQKEILKLNLEAE